MKKERDLLSWKWVGYALLGLFLIVLLLSRGCSSTKEQPKRKKVTHTTRTANVHSRFEETLQIVNVKYNVNKWAYVSLVKARDMCPSGWHVGFQFRSASQPYVVKNMTGNLLYSNNCEDISSQLGYTDENLFLYFRAQKEPGDIKIKIYAYK